MKTLAEWEAMDDFAQVEWWPAIAEDQRAQFLSRAKPVASLVLACPLKLNGDHAGNRVAMRAALNKGDWINMPATLVRMRDGEWLQMHTRMSTAMENGRRNWQQGLEPGVLENWPASQLISVTGRMPAGVKERWTAAGGRIVRGKMMALKTDPVWARFSKFGRPHPPFDAEDILDVEDIDADDAQILHR
jgi:hypothetical protein